MSFPEPYLGIKNVSHSYGQRTALDNLSLTTGVTDPGAPQRIHVYPNPAREIFYLQLPVNDDSEVDLFDIAGKKVYTTTQHADHLSMDVRGFAEGMYLLKVTAGEKSFTQKVAVMH